MSANIFGIEDINILLVLTNMESPIAIDVLSEAVNRLVSFDQWFREQKGHYWQISPHYTILYYIKYLL